MEWISQAIGPGYRVVDKTASYYSEAAKYSRVIELCSNAKDVDVVFWTQETSDLFEFKIHRSKHPDIDVCIFHLDHVMVLSSKKLPRAEQIREFLRQHTLLCGRCNKKPIQAVNCDKCCGCTCSSCLTKDDTCVCGEVLPISSIPGIPVMDDWAKLLDEFRASMTQQRKERRRRDKMKRKKQSKKKRRQQKKDQDQGGDSGVSRDDPTEEEVCCSTEGVEGGEGGSSSKGTEECSICSEDMLDGICTTRCNHLFHKECIEAWRATCHDRGWPELCPMCRRVVIIEN